MTEERKPKIENLELNKETLTDLIELQVEAAQGGALAGATDLGADPNARGGPRESLPTRIPVICSVCLPPAER